MSRNDLSKFIDFSFSFNRDTKFLAVVGKSATHNMADAHHFNGGHFFPAALNHFLPADCESSGDQLLRRRSQSASLGHFR